MFFAKYGRINRATYFVCLAILAVIWTAAIVTRLRVPGEIFAFIFAVPRLHDIGKSAWWAGSVIALEVIAVSGALPFALAASKVSIMELAGGFIAIILWALMIALGCIRGQEGVNKYGEAPPAGISFKTYRMTRTAAEAEADAF